ncbi:MAG: peptidylprolyl isomerase [Candidatus Omnitrophota bacterium]
MKRSRICRNSICLTAALAAALFFCASGGRAAELVDRIIAIVNDEIITEGDISGMLRPLYIQFSTIYGGDQLTEKIEEARQKVINQLVEQKLLLSEAKKQEIVVTEKDLDEEMKVLEERLGSRSAVRIALKQEGITMSQLKKRYQDKIMVRKLVQKVIAPKISVTPVDIREYYILHREEFSEPDQVRLRNIMIKVDGARPPEQAYNLIRELYARLLEGGSFEILAREYSEGPGSEDGGSMGLIKKGSLRKEFDDEIFKMKAGEFSRVIQSPVGYHIFKVEEKVEANDKSLDNVQRDIERKLFSDRMSEEVVRWVEDLKQDAYISFR